MNYDAAADLTDLEADTAYHAVKACIAAQALQRCGVPSLWPDVREAMELLREISEQPGAPDLGVVRRVLERLKGVEG